MPVGQRGSGDVRPLLVIYHAGGPSVNAAVGKRTCVVGGLEPYTKFHPSNLPLDEIEAHFEAELGVKRFSPIVIAGYSAGCQGVRLQLLEGYCPDAVVAIDGTHSSRPPQEWQIEVWRRWFERCGAPFDGHSFNDRAPRRPRRPLARVTCSQVEPATFTSTHETLELVTGWSLGRAPSDPPIRLTSGNLELESFAGQAAEHLRQGSVVLPAELRDVADELGMRKGRIRPRARGCPPRIARRGGRVMIGALLSVPAVGWLAWEKLYG